MPNLLFELHLQKAVALDNITLLHGLSRHWLLALCSLAIELIAQAENVRLERRRRRDKWRV